MKWKSPLHLFNGFGIEIEYMIVNSETMQVCPAAEILLKSPDGAIENQTHHGELDWSNELVQHVIELKTAQPVPSLSGLADFFQNNILVINDLLRPNGCQLLPGATHPFMNPLVETHIWEKEYTEIYQTFNAIFDCRGHGWSNLQSMHINLPFCGDEEFFRLHNAIRMILAFIPGLTAASPFQDGVDTGFADSRMLHYGRNSAKIPSVTGLIVPEPVTSEREYRERILERIYRDLAPHDPKGILQDEWANARGAITRFSRGAVEIRVIDSQECPQADIAIAELVCDVVRTYTECKQKRRDFLHMTSTELLHKQMLACIEQGETALILTQDLREVLAVPAHVATVGQLWQYWAEQSDNLTEPSQKILNQIFAHGSLATRMRRGCPNPSVATLTELCHDLAASLAEGRLYLPI